MMILIGHSTYLKVTEGNARYATFPNTVKFQLQEEVLARSATTAETLLASEKPRISHLKFSSSDILPIVIECWMANVPEHGQISARFQQGPLQTLNLLGKRFLNMKIVSFVPFRHQTFYSIECQLASSLRRLSPKLAKRQQLPRDRCKYVLEMKLVLHVMGRTPGTFPLERCELFDWLRKRHER